MTKFGLLLSLVLAAPAAAGQPSWTLQNGTLSLTATGYMEVCGETGKLFKLAGKEWKPAQTDLPPKGLYFLDGRFVGYSSCDNVVCSPITAALRVLLLEFKPIAAKEPPADSGSTTKTVPAFHPVVLKGRLRYKLRYFKDARCRQPLSYTAEFRNP